jgi:hypothetical protein
MGFYGSTPKAPDYTPLADASKESAEIMADLQREINAENARQYDQTMQAIMPVLQQQGSIAAETAAQGREDRAYNIEVFRPLERGLVADARAYHTDAKREELAAQAAADVGRAFGNTQNATGRAMASMGVNPNSGKARAMQNQNALSLAAMRANAMTGTRQQAENIGYARKLDAAGLGRNLTGASQGAYALSLNAGNSLVNNTMAPGTRYLNTMAQGANVMASGRNMLQNGLTGVLDSQTSVYKADSQSGLDVGGVLSGVANVYTAFSDPRLKENVEPVGRDEETGLTIYEFNYLDQPDRRYRGVMADEVQGVCPDAVMTDDSGYLMVNYDLLGIEMVEVRDAA